MIALKGIGDLMNDAITYEELVAKLPSLEKQLKELLAIAEKNKENEKN